MPAAVPTAVPAAVPTAMFTAVEQQRGADAVFDQVRTQIVSGTLTPGQALPGERVLSGQLNVSRGVVREALQRLAQAGLLDIRQGGSTRVLDYQASTDLGLLAHILVRPDRSLNTGVLRSVLEMRISIGIDAASLAAQRSTLAQQRTLTTIIDQLAVEDEVQRQQDLDLEFWSTVVQASGNLAYRIAYNGLSMAYRPLRDVVAAVVVPELEDVDSHREMVVAFARRDAERAGAAAKSLLESSKQQWDELLNSLDPADEQ